MFTENQLRTATLVALVIVMVASVLSAVVNWQTWWHREQMQGLYLDWQSQRAALEGRLASVERELAKLQQPQRQQQ